MAGFPTDLSNLLTNLVGSNASGNLTGGGVLGLLGLGSTDPLYNLMALASFVQEGQLTQEQLGFINNTLNQQSSAMNTAMDPNKLAATANALQVPGFSTDEFGNMVNQLTQQLSPELVANTLNPVDARLAASGQATSPAVREYVSQQALAPFEQQEQQMAYGGAGQLTSQHLQEQQMARQLAEFGLGLPFNAQPKYPDFSVIQPGSQNDLLSALSSGFANNSTADLLNNLGSGNPVNGLTNPFAVNDLITGLSGLGF